MHRHIEHLQPHVEGLADSESTNTPRDDDYKLEWPLMTPVPASEDRPATGSLPRRVRASTPI